MKRFGARALAAVTIGLMLSVAGVTSASAGPLEDVVAAVNTERQWAGQRPLVRDATLDRAAQEWAQTMSSTGRFEHSTNEWRAARIPANWSSHGENIAYGHRTPGDVMYSQNGTGWMTSEGHRKNILRPNFTHIGMGYVASGNYWVQIFAGYTAANAPAGLAKGPWELYRPAHLSTIYELIKNSDGSRTPTPISSDRWNNVYGQQAPFPAPTSFVKYPWSPTLYAVTFWPGSDSSWQWDALTPDQWRYAGTPAPRAAGWIKGSTIYKWDTAPELFLRGADGSVHKLTSAEWNATGSRAFENRSEQGYLKLTWDSSIKYYPDLATGMGVSSVGYADWSKAAFPTPRQLPRLPGDSFTKRAGAATIYYVAPGQTDGRAITYSEWVAAGSPQPSVT